MSLNKLLCKAFDKEKKGYATIGDMLKSVIITGSITLIGWSIIYSTYRFVTEGGFNKPNPEIFSWHMLGFIVIMNTGFVLTLIAIIRLYEAIKYIANIRVAKCPLKENENK